MKIFVTGSESFVGRELVSRCLSRGIEVVGVDLVEPERSRYKFRKGDIKSPNIGNFIPEGVDAVVHLAALSRDQDSKNKAYECFETNVLGTLNVMRGAAEKNAKQFIFASSEWVYNDFKPGEVKDEDSFIDMAAHASAYALSKLVSEANLRQEYGRGFCPVTVLRFAIIYGPRPSSNWSAVESLASAVKNRGEVKVGSLRSGRRFLHVSDIVEGIVKSFGLKGFNIINLAGDKLVTIADIIRESEKIFGKKVKVIESAPGEASVRNPSNEKSKKLLGWSQEIDLPAGLKTLLPFV